MTRAFSAAAATTPRPALPLLRRLPQQQRQQPFSQTTRLAGKKKHREKAKKAAAEEEEDEDGDNDHWGEDQLPSESRKKAKNKFEPGSDFDHEAAFDLADVEAEYHALDERFGRRLREFKSAGGRFNPDLLGQLRVKPDRASSETYPLRELAQVVHRGGRSVSILVSDQSYVKPIMSAVQASDAFNQQPQPDPDNDLELTLRIEPENPDEQAKRVRAECNDWKDAVRGVLSTRKSKHATWQKAKYLTRDDVKNLDKAVKAMQDKKMDAIEKTEKQIVAEMAAKQKRL